MISVKSSIAAVVFALLLTMSCSGQKGSSVRHVGSPASGGDWGGGGSDGQGGMGGDIEPMPLTFNDRE